MAPTPRLLRKAIGLVKDKTSIGIAKVAGSPAWELEVLVVKATSHDDVPAGDSDLQRIIDITLWSPEHVKLLVAAVAKRLSRTRDWIVAVKCLALVHMVSNDGNRSFPELVLTEEKEGVRILNFRRFEDEGHSGSLHHWAFVRLYAAYLVPKLESLVAETTADRFWRRARSQYDGSTVRGSLINSSAPAPATDMKKLAQSLRILDRVVTCRPVREATNSRLIMTAFYHIIRESSGVYAGVRAALEAVFRSFTAMERGDCVDAFELCSRAKRTTDELAGFYQWCRDSRVARPSELPEVQRLSYEVLGSLEAFLKEKLKDASPPPENHAPPPPPPPLEIPDLLSGPMISTIVREGLWETFSPERGEPELSSERQNSNSGLELVPVESAVNPEPNLGRFEPEIQDPFEASLAVPPPAYVQMAERERHVWQMSSNQTMPYNYPPPPY